MQSEIRCLLNLNTYFNHVLELQYNFSVAKCPLPTISLWAGVVGHDADHSTLQVVCPHCVPMKMKL